MNKVIVRIKGGLGNQLFSYAAARAVALRNDAELALDHVTGFRWDHRYRRQYMLDRFAISARTATAGERLEPFGRIRRSLAKARSRRRPFPSRRYIEQEGLDFDPRLGAYRVDGCVYLDGYWQSEGYFKDVEDVIRSDLRRRDTPNDQENVALSEAISDTPAVAVHVRWFGTAGNDGVLDRMASYYGRAIHLMEETLARPRYVLFSDDIDAARRLIQLPADRVMIASGNRGDAAAVDDLWLMSLCRHFVIANSTFSWWAAWLGTHPGKIVLAPGWRTEGEGAWGFEGLIPKNWTRL